jgi:hypothetical protein
MLRALGAGLELHPRTFAGLRSGIRSAQRWLADPGKGPGSSRGLPVEVIYQGGDDLLCMLPSSLLDPFLGGFAAPRRILAARTFTGVAITLPGVLVRQGSQVPFLIARMVPVALEWAKRRSRGLPCRSLETRLRRAAREKGCVLRFLAQPRDCGTKVMVWQIALEAVPASTGELS